MRSSRYLWVDIDADRPEPALKAAEKLKDMRLRPAFAVSSGSGYGIHYYFRVEPTDLSVETERIRFENILKRLANYLGGDPACCDCSRVMRLPGSLNHKYDPPALVTGAAINTRVYTLNEFDYKLPKLPEVEPIRREPVMERGNYPPGSMLRYIERLMSIAVPVGERHNTLLRMGANLTLRGADPSLISSALRAKGRDMNLPEKEIEGIIRWIQQRLR